MPQRNLQIILVALLVAAFCHHKAARIKPAGVITEAVEMIDALYVDPVERGDLIEAAMSGLTSRLDQHSEFIPAHRYGAFNELLQQEFAGVGMLVEQPEPGKPVRVITPLVGSPALSAGIMPGDEIVEVAGEDVSVMELPQVTQRLRGPVGSEVQVRVRRGPADDPQLVRISLQRQRITLESVVGDHRDADDQWVFRLRRRPHIAYIRVTTFGEKTGSELRQVLQSLDNDFESLVLDVRGNVGGLLTAAVDVCDMFLDNGRIVTIKGRGGHTQSSHGASQGTLVSSQIPMAVLIDSDSASASEIVAACLKDHGRATIVGARSYGKGTVQNVLPLEFGRSALRLTTARYYRPNGVNIHRAEDAEDEDPWGVRPHSGFEVLMSEEDYRLLVEHWQQASFPVSTNGQPDRGDSPAASSKDARGRVIDPQLARAIEHLDENRGKR